MIKKALFFLLLFIGSDVAIAQNVAEPLAKIIKAHEAFQKARNQSRSTTWPNYSKPILKKKKKHLHSLKESIGDVHIQLR